MSAARASVVDFATAGQLVSARMSPFASERPLSAPKTATVEKAATSTERSILLRIVGFVLRIGSVSVTDVGEIDARHNQAASRRAGASALPVASNAITCSGSIWTSSAAPGDVLMMFSEHGRQPALCQIGRLFRERGGKVVTVTRHTPNPLRAYADATLLVSAHDERRHIEPLLYQCALQHLLDLIFVLLCDASEGRRSQLDINLERMQDLLDS